MWALQLLICTKSKQKKGEIKSVTFLLFKKWELLVLMFPLNTFYNIFFIFPNRILIQASCIHCILYMFHKQVNNFSLNDFKVLQNIWFLSKEFESLIKIYFWFQIYFRKRFIWKKMNNALRIVLINILILFNFQCEWNRDKLFRFVTHIFPVGRPLSEY